MPEDPSTLQVIAENYGLPGMVLFALALLIGFLSFGLPRLITAIQGRRAPARDNEEGDGHDKPSKRSPGAHTMALYTREEVSKAREDIDERVDLKLAPLQQAIDTLKAEMEAAKGRDKEHYSKLDKLSEHLSEVRSRLARVETARKRDD